MFNLACIWTPLNGRRSKEQSLKKRKREIWDQISRFEEFFEESGEGTDEMRGDVGVEAEELGFFDKRPFIVGMIAVVVEVGVVVSGLRRPRSVDISAYDMVGENQ